MAEDCVELRFRKAERTDVPLVLQFIRHIAEYERLSSEVAASEEVLEKWLFDEHSAEVIFVMAGGKEVGFAVYFFNFSTFTGRAGLYLEDLFVLPEYRGCGYGKALFLQLVEIAYEKGCGRMEWVCLDWNSPSIAFYKSMGASAMDDWTIYRLTRDGMKNLVR